jgi:hypothetical protein
MSSTEETISRIEKTMSIINETPKIKPNLELVKTILNDIVSSPVVKLDGIGKYCIITSISEGSYDTPITEDTMLLLKAIGIEITNSEWYDHRKERGKGYMSGKSLCVYTNELGIPLMKLKTELMDTFRKSKE